MRIAACFKGRGAPFRRQSGDDAAKARARGAAPAASLPRPCKRRRCEHLPLKAPLHGFERTLASSFTALARIGADPTMLVHGGVTLAFLTAKSARGNARLQHFANDFFVGSSSAGGQCGSCGADVRTVQVQPDTLAELSHHLFCKACVSARCTSLGTGVRLFYCFDERFVDVPTDVRVLRDHLLCVHN